MERDVGKYFMKPDKQKFRINEDTLKLLKTLYKFGVGEILMIEVIKDTHGKRMYDVYL